MGTLSVAGASVAPGTTQLVRVPVTRDLGVDIDLHAHVVAGAADGPTLLLLSMLHGNEWFSVLILRELLRRLEPDALAGQVIAVPVANPSAFLTGSRCILDDSDEPDANRSFGGPYRWLSNQLTGVITESFLRQSDYLVDYHVSDWGSTMADVSYVEDYADAGVARRSREMAVAFGFPVIHRLRIFEGLRGGRTSLGYAGQQLGVPGVVAEIGGLGFGEALEREWLEANVEGTLSVMRHLGMLAGPPLRRSRYLFIGDYWRVSPSVGGYLEPAIGLDRQLTEVRPGELLARVTSPTSLQVVEELRSPGQGTIFYACRAHMVRPGGWAFGVANMEDERSVWAPG